MWNGDWRAKVRSRLHEIGCETVHDFLARYPGEPYRKLVSRLGGDVAALQLTMMQLEESGEQGGLRDTAKDRLARLVNGHLKKGWAQGQHADFNTAGVYADWVTELERFQPYARQFADAVWQALLSIPPPAGWKPSGADDPILTDAFDRAWPG